MTLPIRSNTLDAIDDVTAAQARVRTALESELTHVYGQMDLLRAEVARLKEERDIAVEALKDVVKR